MTKIASRFWASSFWTFNDQYDFWKGTNITEGEKREARNVELRKKERKKEIEVEEEEAERNLVKIKKYRINNEI